MRSVSESGERHRVLKDSSSNPGGGWTVFVHGLHGELLGEYDQQTGSAIREYVWLGRTPAAVLGRTATAGADEAFFLHTDHLDTPRLDTDRLGRVRWNWMAEPFGNEAANPQPTAGLDALNVPLRMPGQYADAESGLFYNHHRYYEPRVGRYVQSDPIGLQGGINTYSYVGGNPVSYVDPEGLQGGPPSPGAYCPRGTMPSGPPRMAENGGYASPRHLAHTFANLPNPAPQLPGGFVGINYPWSMPNIGPYCAQCSPANLGEAASDGMRCPKPQAPQKLSVASAPGQGPACVCTQWVSYQAGP